MLKYNLDEKVTTQIYDLVDKYEISHEKLDKEDLLNYINRELNLNLDMKIIDGYIKALNTCIYKEDGIEEIICYLKEKYDLYVVSNWFTSSQKERLKKIGIAKYFKDIIGADINYFKPHIKSLDIILKHYEKENCILIGDSYEKDIMLAKKLNIRAIWLTDEEMENCEIVHKLSDLRKVL